MKEIIKTIVIIALFVIVSFDNFSVGNEFKGYVSAFASAFNVLALIFEIKKIRL